ncbi:MAG TPA: hypothetical protein VIC33_04175 [Vicinamibacterales bacterium]
MAETRLERRLRWAGLLIALGMIVQSITLAVLHPLAFVAFIVMACPLMGAGIVLFLVAILKGDSA